MTIAINTAYPTANPFIFECFSRIAKKYPQHQFIYIFDRPFNEQFITSKNINGVIATKRSQSPLLWPYWYNYKLPAILRKYKADVFVSADGICSLRTRIPQCLILQDLDFLQAPAMMLKTEQRFYKKHTGRFLTKAKQVVTTSAVAATKLATTYKMEAEKIRPIYPGIDPAFKPISEPARELIKEKFAGGKEYFLFAGDIDPRNDLLNLLKAFSFFKKRQKSNMQLLLAGSLTGDHKKFTAELASFKYRNEVKILTGLTPTEQAGIMAAAYAFVYPVLSQNSAPQLPEAMHCEVPVICSRHPGLAEICGEAALYADGNNFSDMAEKMMLVFKDEDKRRELIQAGSGQLKRYDWDKTAAELWQLVTGAIQA